MVALRRLAPVALFPYPARVRPAALNPTDPSYRRGAAMAFRHFLVAGLCPLALLLCCGLAMAADTRPEGASKLWVYVGTYTGPKSKGIYRCELDLATGKLTPPQLAAEIVNPSFL